MSMYGTVNARTLLHEPGAEDLHTIFSPLAAAWKNRKSQQHSNNSTAHLNNDNTAYRQDEKKRSSSTTSEVSEFTLADDDGASLQSKTSLSSLKAFLRKEDRTSSSSSLKKQGAWLPECGSCRKKVVGGSEVGLQAEARATHMMILR